MTALEGRIVWVTGAGSGIGEAIALSFAKAGSTVVLTGRRQDALASVAHRIAEAGGTAHVAPGDLGDPASAGRIVADIESGFGRLDILVNNAGLNVQKRAWADLTTEAIDTLVNGNLLSAIYCSAAAMHPMRRQGGGQLIHTASWAGKYIHPVSGPVYTAAKHAVVAMSQSINMEEYGNGIRSTAILPAEVATPILDKRPQPPSAEVRATMLQPADLAALVLFVASQPPHVCINEVTVSPTKNRMYAL